MAENTEGTTALAQVEPSSPQQELPCSSAIIDTAAQDEPSSLQQELSCSSARIKFADLEFFERAGAGDSGHVWRGKWKSKNVAIKKVLDSPEKVIQILRLLSHPSIIRYYGTVTENVSYFTVTEFAENGSIYDYIHVHNKQPSLAQRLLWLKQVAEGMAYLHDYDVFHRNLKSSNVVLTSKLDAKIVDLNCARTMTRTAKQTTIIGTFAWIAPEVVRGESVSIKSDVYSYGILTWEIITQKVPFSDVDSFALPFMVATLKHPTIPDDCEPRLANLMESCWKEREARPSFEEVLGSLNAESAVEPPPSPPPSTATDTLVYADLEFIDRVGRGGYGTVWKGQWKALTVAIKAVIDLNEREIEVLSSLHHPSVIHYYGTVQEQIQYYIVTEFADNGSIFDYIHGQPKELSLEQGLLWLKQVAEGMIYLHGRNIIHRDLKSSNVVLMSSLDAKIVDLGCAQTLEHTMKQTSIVGTCAWIAPEMMRREPVSKSCDVYSYGIFAWEIITRKVPFSDVKSYEISMRVAKGEHPPIPHTCESYLADLLECCWKERKARPTFEEISQALNTKSAVPPRPSLPPSTTKDTLGEGQQQPSPPTSAADTLGDVVQQPSPPPSTDTDNLGEGQQQPSPPTSTADTLDEGEQQPSPPTSTADTLGEVEQRPSPPPSTDTDKLGEGQQPPSPPTSTADTLGQMPQQPLPPPSTDTDKLGEVVQQPSPPRSTDTDKLGQGQQQPSPPPSTADTLGEGPSPPTSAADTLGVGQQQPSPPTSTADTHVSTKD